MRRKNIDFQLIKDLPLSWEEKSFSLRRAYKIKNRSRTFRSYVHIVHTGRKTLYHGDRSVDDVTMSAITLRVKNTFAIFYVPTRSKVECMLPAPLWHDSSSVSEASPPPPPPRPWQISTLAPRASEECAMKKVTIFLTQWYLHANLVNSSVPPRSFSTAFMSTADH